MKWLFALLVALNILVLGFNVAGKIAQQQKAVIDPGVPLGEGKQSLPLPPNWQMAEEQEASAPDWITTTVAEGEEAIPMPSEKNKTPKPEHTKPNKTEAGTTAIVRTPPKNCTANATIVIDEDDYHRIKGLLGAWPHAATRVIEQRQRKKSTQAAKKSYRVVLPTRGDALAELDRLAGKGFTASLYQGDISAGVVGSKSAAQILISRLTGAGFGGARVVEQQSDGAANAALTVARMRIVFFSVNDAAAREIHQVLKSYGRLNRSCR